MDLLSTTEVAENVFLHVKRIETQATDNAHTVYIYIVNIMDSKFIRSKSKK